MFELRECDPLLMTNMVDMYGHDSSLDRSNTSSGIILSAQVGVHELSAYDAAWLDVGNARELYKPQRVCVDFV